MTNEEIINELFILMNKLDWKSRRDNWLLQKLDNLMGNFKQNWCE